MTWLLSLLLGVFGADRFYLGKIGTAIAKLLTLGGFGVWWLIDLGLTVFGKQTDKLGRPLAGYSGLRTVSLIVTPIVVVLLLVINPMRSVGASDDDQPRSADAAPAAVVEAPETEEPAEAQTLEPIVAEPTTPAVVATQTPVAAAPAAPAAPYGVAYPAAQQQFLDRVQQASAEYDAATTDLQSSQALVTRNADLCAMTGGAFDGWVGRVLTVGSTGDGNAYIDIEIAENVVVSTWNNEFSDIGDNTLIPSGSELFNQLVAMPEDSLVVFSGRFAPDGDSCLKTDNLTEIFDAIDPNFVSSFTAVSKQ